MKPVVSAMEAPSLKSHNGFPPFGGETLCLRQETARGPKNRKTMDLLAEGGQKGRPAKGRTFAEVLRAVGEEKGMMEAVARRVWAMARGGNMTAVGFIADRLDGKVEARVKVEDKHNFTADFDLLRKALTSGVEGEEP